MTADPATGGPATSGPATANPATIGAILAGGLARRLGGGDKTLRDVGGQTVLARLIERLRPGVTRLIINANDDPARFAAHDAAIVPDTLPDHPSPQHEAMRDDFR